MRLNINISDNVGKDLKDHTKENNSTMTKTIETALVMYLTMFQGAKKMADTIEAMNYKKPIIKKDQKTKKDN